MADDEKPSTSIVPLKPAPASKTSAEVLRAFEDKHLGEGAVRIHGKIEKGIGSKFHSNSESWGHRHRDHHTALEELVAAEKAHVEAGAAETAAHARLQAAIDRVNATEPRD